jgi:hypothetical protein
MSKVKGSRQYPMKVVPHRPYYRAFSLLIYITLFVVAVLTSGYLGHYKGIKTSYRLATESQELKRLYADKKNEADKLLQEVTNLKLGTQVDRKAEEDTHSEMVMLKARVAELEQETAFYRGLMRPNADDSGLTIGTLDIVKTSTPRRYEYKLVIQQLGAQHQLVKGYVEFTIVGRQIPDIAGETKPVTQEIALKDVSKDVSEVLIPLRFKYFQRFEGELDLPIKFEPESIEIKATPDGKDSAMVEKKFNWLVQEM